MFEEPSKKTGEGGVAQLHTCTSSVDHQVVLIGRLSQRLALAHRRCIIACTASAAGARQPRQQLAQASGSVWTLLSRLMLPSRRVQYEH